MYRSLRITKFLWPGVLLGGAGVLLCSCSDATDPIICTQIGCYSGLEVELLGTLPVEYRLELKVPGSKEFYFDCTADSPCWPPIFIQDFFPETVRVTVSSGDQSWTTVANPEYEEYQPNGPQCPPTCRLGRVSLQVGS